MTRSLRTRSERIVCQRYCLSRCRNTGFPAARWVKIHETRRRLSYTAAVAFDAAFARDVVLQLAEAAYKVMGGGSATVPSGYIQTSVIRADAALLTAMTSPHPAVAAMTKNTDIFGLMGHNRTTRTAFVSFRGTSDVEDWLADLDAIPDAYLPVSGFGQVHAGFQDVYELVQKNIAANLAAATAGCDQILITGHSLGAALAVLAAPDVFRSMPPNTIEPRPITFAGPRAGADRMATQPDRLPERALGSHRCPEITALPAPRGTSPQVPGAPTFSSSSGLVGPLQAGIVAGPFSCQPPRRPRATARRRAGATECRATERLRRPTGRRRPAVVRAAWRSAWAPALPSALGQALP